MNLTRYHSDWKKFRNWLSERNPFCFEDANLYSLASGFISGAGKDEVNCEQAEEVRLLVHSKMDNQKMTEVKIKRKDQIKALDVPQNTVKINQEKVYVNSITLFTRLAAVAKRDDDDEERFFKYELTTEPMSLFKQSIMRKPDKPALRR